MSGGPGDKGPERTIVVRASPLSQIRRAQGQPPADQPRIPDDAVAAPADQGAPAYAAQAPRELQPEIEAETALPPLEVRNPLVWLASRILVRLAGMRTGQMPVTAPQFHAEMVEAITAYKDTIADIGYDRETVDNATYAVAATVDDVMQNIPQTQGFEWARRSMVVQMFGENIGGDRFWATVDDLLRRPSGKDELLELFHACVAAGFLGKYRLSGRQDRGLSDRMAAMHAELARSIQKTGEPLVPHWRGVEAPMRKVPVAGPLIGMAALCGVILLGAFAFFLFQLADRTDDANARLASLHDITTPVVIERNTPPPVSKPPEITSTRLERIRTRLASEIAAGDVVVEGKDARIRITTRIGSLFRSGSDVLDPSYLPFVAAVAAALEAEVCKITIVGHTDSDKLTKTLKFPDNQALSEARAISAATELKKGLSDPSRIVTEGRGDLEPVSASDKALNRRIEIFVPLREGE
ncbi:MAG: DotU/TssL family secretion system protein [Micropepsaceae bacterium]